jgi:hypothetical protein
MPKPLFNLSKKTLSMFNKAIKLDNLLKNCTNKKCSKIITKKNKDKLSKKHHEYSFSKCVKSKNILKCNDSLNKEDKFGYIKIQKELDECSKKECKKEYNNNNKFIKQSEKVKIGKNTKISL